VEPPADGWWIPSALQRLTISNRQGVFVLLGTVETGKWLLWLQLYSEDQLRVQVVSLSFDILVDETLWGVSEWRAIAWEADEAGPHFVRVISRRPMGGLSIHRMPQP